MAFTTNVMDSTQEQDPDQLDSFLNAAQKRAADAQKQFGSMYDTRAPEMTLADRMKARQTWNTGEQARREAASKGAYDVGQKIDTQNVNVADQVRSALFGRQQLASDTAEKQRQQDVVQGQTIREQDQNFIQKLSQLEYQATEGAANRMDSMQAAYDKGVLEFQMIDLQNQGMLGMSDLERYFSIQLNDIENKMKDMALQNKYDVDTLMEQIESQSQGWGTLLSSLAKGAAAIVTGGK